MYMYVHVHPSIHYINYISIYKCITVYTCMCIYLSIDVSIFPQVIALLDALMLNSDTTNINTVLVLCPVNTLYNWSVEWNKWLPITLRDYHVSF